MAQYDYSISGDTATGAVNSEQLWTELLALAVANPGYPALTNIATELDDLAIYYATPLSAGQETLLTGAVAAHTPAAPVAPSPTTQNQVTNTDPTANDDDSLGYQPSVRWLNVTSQEEFVCVDSSTGAAVWASTTSGGGGGSPAVYVDYYDATTSAVGVTPTTLTLDTARQSNAAFALAANTATVQAGGGGDYLIRYDVTFDESDTTTRVVSTWLELNGSEVPATRGEASHWYTGGTAGVDGTCGRTAILTLVAGDDLQVMAEVTTGTAGYDTATGGVGLVIAAIGEQGPQGPTGAGSNVIVEDSGTPIAGGPHSNLNFIGFTSVSDAGGGTADITAPVSSVFGQDYQVVGSRPKSTTTSSSFQTKVTLTTPVLTGTYRVVWQAVIDQSNTQDSVEARLQNTTLGVSVGTFQRMEPKDTDNQIFAGGAGGVVFASQTMDFEIQWRQQDGSTAGIQDAVIEIWRIS